MDSILDFVEVLRIGPAFRVKIGNGASEPFAAVAPCVESDKGTATPRMCISFSLAGKDYEFCDAVIGWTDRPVRVGEAIFWPELYKALARRARSFEQLLPLVGQKPHIRLKNWVEDEEGDICPNPQGHGARAWRILENWNKWNRKGLGWRDRIEDCYDVGGLKQTQLDAYAESLKKECGRMGLKNGIEVEVTRPRREVLRHLRFAAGQV